MVEITILWEGKCVNSRIHKQRKEIGFKVWTSAKKFISHGISLRKILYKMQCGVVYQIQQKRDLLKYCIFALKRLCNCQL